MAATKNIASVLKPPVGEVVVASEKIIGSAKARDLGFVAVGAADRAQREIQPDNNGIAYVDMNSSGRMVIENGKDAVIATSALSGCTGVAGFAKRTDGSIATFVSHYDTVSQTYHFTHQDSPLNSQLYGFGYDAGKDLTTPIKLLVAYNATTHHNPALGDRSKVFDEWTYLDQIQNTSAQLGEKAEVLLLPYQSGQGSTLASGRINGEEGIFWNGVKVDFDAYFTQKDPAVQS